MPHTGKATILVVDDEIQIQKLLRITLELAGYAVREAHTGKEGIAEVARSRPDAIVLDLGLPDMGGIDVVRELRGWSRVPILVLTVKATEADKVEALDAGADDYLTKPFGAAEITARLRAILRRVTEAPEETVVRFGPIEIDLVARVVRKAGTEVRLTAKEYAMLKLLVTHRGKVVTHGHMLRELWGPKSDENTHYLRVHMTHIRQKLEDDPHRPRYLRTESGIGYRLMDR